MSRLKCKGFGERLRFAIYTHGYTVTTFALRAGYARNTISHYLMEDFYPNISSVEMFAEILGVSPAVLCGWAKEEAEA